MLYGLGASRLVNTKEKQTRKMDALLGDGSTHTPGQPPSATSVCIHQAGLRTYGVYHAKYLADT